MIRMKNLIRSIHQANKTVSEFLNYVGCIIQGHSWEFQQKIAVERPMHNVAIWIEDFYHIWRCKYCGTVIRAKTYMKPDNLQRRKYEVIDAWLDHLIE